MLLAQLQLSFVGDVQCSFSLHFVVLTRPFISVQVESSESVRFPITIRIDRESKLLSKVQQRLAIRPNYTNTAPSVRLDNCAKVNVCLFILSFVPYSSTAHWSNTCLWFRKLSASMSIQLIIFCCEFVCACVRCL